MTDAPSEPAPKPREYTYEELQAMVDEMLAAA